MSEDETREQPCGVIRLPCVDEFANVNKKLDLLDVAIRGNGQPGLKSRVERLEAAANALSRLMWVVVAAVVPLVLGAVWKAIVLLERMK